MEPLPAETEEAGKPESCQAKPQVLSAEGFRDAIHGQRLLVYREEMELFCPLEAGPLPSSQPLVPSPPVFPRGNSVQGEVVSSSGSQTG